MARIPSLRHSGHHGWLLLAFWLVILIRPTGAVAAVPSITVLLSQHGGVYEEVAQRLSEDLRKECGQCPVQVLGLGDSAATNDADLLVTLGVAALQAALVRPGNEPVLALLVPRRTYESLLGETPGNGRQRAVTAIHLDQPLSRQLRLIRKALPQVRRIGVLLGDAYASQADELQRSGRAAGFEVHTRTIGEPGQLFAALAALAAEVDTLLLLPDPKVVNASTLQSLFLYTYRRRLPIVAYSESLVKAGALLGLHATPQQIAAEAAGLVRDLLRQDPPRAVPARPPQAYTVEVNRNVARSLELHLPSVQSLAASLGQDARP